MTDSTKPIQNNSANSGFRSPDGLAVQPPGPDSATLANTSLTSGGMRGIGLVTFLIAQITLKLETVKLAKKYYKTGKKDFDFFKATHQPGAQQSVAEAMSDVLNPKFITDLYASAPAGMAKSKIVDKTWFAARRRTHRYAVGAQRRLDYDFSQARTAAIVSGWNMGRRYETAWADSHNERRFNRRLGMANLGIGYGNIIRQGLATAVGNLTSAQTEVSNTVASIGNGYFAKAGYEDARRDTQERYDEMTDSTRRR